MPIDMKDVPYDDSLEAVALPYGYNSKLRVSPTLQAAQPLTVDRTVYVDSVAGNDANTGTQAAPFQTFARAWAERQKYGVLRAKFTIQLNGVGPYTMPARLSASLCDLGGYLIIRGDEAVEVTHATGTFTGDFAGPTIGTSSGLGSDTHKNRWVKITSGPAAGCVFMVAKNTDTAITASNRRFKSAGSTTITAGTEFKIFTPGTQVTTNGARIDSWRGGEIPVTADIRHVWLGIAFTGSMGASNSEACFMVCSATGSFTNYHSIVATQFLDGTVLGAPQHAYRSAGIVVNGWSQFGGYAYATFSTTAASVVTVNGSIDHLGGRFAAFTASGGGIFRTGASSGDAFYRFDNTFTASQGGHFEMQSNGNTAEFAVTTGSCFRANRDGRILHTTGAYAGGTTDPAGFAIDVSGGGRCYTQTGAFTGLVGGTAGKDLKTTNNGGVASSVLSGIGTSAGVAADALLGEVLARVA